MEVVAEVISVRLGKTGNVDDSDNNGDDGRVDSGNNGDDGRVDSGNSGDDSGNNGDDDTVDDNDRGDVDGEKCNGFTMLDDDGNVVVPVDDDDCDDAGENIGESSVGGGDGGNGGRGLEVIVTIVRSC